MRKTLRPIVIVPFLIGMVLSCLIFLVIWERRKESLRPKRYSSSITSLPKARLINILTNQDEYEKLNKGKVLLVFLTTNCDACKKDIPNISQALPILASKVAVYGVVFEERNNVDSFVQENQIKFPILIDRGGKVITDLGISLFPAKVLLENGTITKIWFGSSPNRASLVKDVGEVELQ